MQFIDDAPASTRASVPQVGAPLHLWAIGVGSLVWNAFGALQYWMAQTRNPTYFAATAEDLGIAPEALLAYADAFPGWTYLAWALGVGGALAGSTLLLLRRRHAVTAFAASLVGLAGSQAYRLAVPQPAWAEQAPGMTITIWGIAIALLLYAMWLRRRGVLR